MLDIAIKEELTKLFAELKSSITLLAEVDPQSPKSSELIEMLEDVASCSPKIELRTLESDTLQFMLLRDDNPSGVIFRAIPNGHEFNSFILAILNLDGQGKNLPDDFTQRRIVALKGEIKLTTYMTLTCPNCPDVVQGLNALAIISPRITHEAVDGGLYEQEVERLGIQSVPTVYADGELLHVGRGGLAELIDKLETKYGAEPVAMQFVQRRYDVTIAGGGPAGATAALYLARKGLSVAIVAERIGGQVNETEAIENIPSILSTTGDTLATNLQHHLLQYPNIDLLENRTIERFVIEDDGHKQLQIKGGEQIFSPQLIIATGAQWRHLNVDGESDYLGRGVAFCPHCDGPLFSGKSVAIIGGGNSGVEAAIDLAGICSHIILFEFLETIKADEVLQKRLCSLENVEVRTNVETTQIIGDGSRVTAIEIKDRATSQVEQIELDGIFVQIGLFANSSIFKDELSCTPSGEIEVDRNGRTSRQGVFAAGDVTDTSYKQIIIAMGEGAKAALATFDDSIRGIF